MLNHRTLVGMFNCEKTQIAQILKRKIWCYRSIKEYKENVSWASVFQNISGIMDETGVFWRA